MEIPNIYFPHIHLALNINSVAFKVFGLSVYWYGIIMAIAIVSGTALVCYIGKKEGLPSDLFIDYVLYALPISVIGARLYFVIFHWDYYSSHFKEILNIRQGGIAIYGCIIAALIFAIFYIKYKKVSFLHFADIAVLGLLLGQAIGRYGNFFNKEAYGKGTDCFFAMALLKNQAKGPFTKEVLDYVVQFPQFGNVVYIQVHPTFLYESCWNLLLLIVLLIYRKRRKREGILFYLYLIGYGIGRWWIEGLRTDQLLIWGTHLPISQVVATISVIVGIIGIYMCRKVKNGKILQ